MGEHGEQAAADVRKAALGAAAVSLLAAWWSSTHGLLLLYADSRSHLTIARRLVDGPNRGIVQLGTVWLPLQHLLLAPLSAFGALWTTGWAGALIGAACMGIEAAALWHITTVLNAGARLAGLLVVVLYVTNPAVLYLHTSAFAEPVLYASVLVATSGLVRWAARDKPFSGGEMALYCGAPAALAVLSRYDGWAFAAVWGACIAVMAWRRWGSGRYAMKLTLCFAVPPFLAAAWWMWFNWVNFGDALEFQRGRYSAQAQQQLLARQGKLPEKGDLFGSIDTFARAAWSAVGWITLVAAVAGVVVLIVRMRRGRGASSPVPRVFALVSVLTLTPAAFYVWSLVDGQVALRLGGDGESIFNLRYGAAVTPGLVILAASALAALGGARASNGAGDAERARWRAGAAVGLALCPFIALALIPGWRNVGVIEEGLEQRRAGSDQWAAASWLGDHVDGGTVLVDDSLNPMLPVIGSGLDHVVAPFSRGWKVAIRRPDGVDYVVVDRSNTDDAVARSVRRDPAFLDGFDVAAQFGAITIYRGTEEAGS